MGAVSLGPFALSPERLIGLLAIAAFVVASAVVTRRWPGLGRWDVGALIAGLISGRVAYVAIHAAAYIEEPLSVLYVWQGGFSAVGAAVGSAAWSMWYLRAHRRLLAAALATVVGSLVVWMAATAIVEASAGEKEQKLPDIALMALDGTPVEMADYRGSPTVVNFWASWCPPCRREMPLLTETARDSTEIVFLLVNQGEDAEVVMRYVEAVGLETDDIVLDPQGRSASHFGIRGLPTTLFFDGDGLLTDHHFGELSRAALAGYLAGL